MQMLLSKVKQCSIVVVVNAIAGDEYDVLGGIVSRGMVRENGRCPGADAQCPKKIMFHCHLFIKIQHAQATNPNW
jgi:hypothetical protein